MARKEIEKKSQPNRRFWCWDFRNLIQDNLKSTCGHYWHWEIERNCSFISWYMYGFNFKYLMWDILCDFLVNKFWKLEIDGLTFVLNVITISVWIPCKSNTTVARRYMIYHSTLSILGTDTWTRVLAFTIDTCFIWWTVWANDTFWSTAFVWVSIIFGQTLTWAYAILLFANSVGGAGIWNTGCQMFNWIVGCKSSIKICIYKYSMFIIKVLGLIPVRQCSSNHQMSKKERVTKSKKQVSGKVLGERNILQWLT